MKFTEHEMVFFNSITKGDAVFGIPLHFRIKEERAEEVEKIIKSLIKKQILKSETELSRLGALPARTLELYKQSKTYIIINYLHIALIDKQEAVVIIPIKEKRKEKEYELLRLPRVAVLYLLLEHYPVLRNAAVETETNVQLIDHDSFLRKLSSYDGNIMVGAFRDSRIVSEHVYYWEGEEILRYDLNSQIEKKVNAVQVRREIMKLLQIEGEVQSHAR